MVDAWLEFDFKALRSFNNYLRAFNPLLPKNSQFAGSEGRMPGQAQLLLATCSARTVTLLTLSAKPKLLRNAMINSNES